MGSLPYKIIFCNEDSEEVGDVSSTPTGEIRLEWNPTGEEPDIIMINPDEVEGLVAALRFIKTMMEMDQADG